MDTALNLREVPVISPDALFQIQYTDKDVLDRIEDIRVRRLSLDKAVTLGKSVKIKTRLVLYTQNGFVQLNKVIVHLLNEKGITIDGDYFIPMHAIYTVDMV
jgi:hypothetical protein